MPRNKGRQNRGNTAPRQGFAGTAVGYVELPGQVRVAARIKTEDLSKLRIGMAVGFDKHPRGAFTVNPEGSGLGKWYGDIGKWYGNIGMALMPAVETASNAVRRA